MKKIIFGILFITAFIAACATQKVKNIGVSKSKKPNIIYVLADDLGYGDLSCFGQQKFKTPYIDRMAAEGLTFTQAYSGSTVCAPSRCALMSGKNTGHCEVRGNGQPGFAANSVIMPELMQKIGYRTGMFGKWGLGNPKQEGSPEKKGWNDFLGYTDHGHAHHYFVDYLIKVSDGKPAEQMKMDKKQHTHPVIFNAALDFVRQNKDKPFFLYLPVTVPHAELVAPTEASLKPFVDATGKSIFPEVPYVNKNPNGYMSQPQPFANFAAMVTQLDSDMGRLMALLKELNLDDNTLVIFTSDNGPHKEGKDPAYFQSSGVLRGIKRDLYEGGIRVPFIAWSPTMVVGKGKKIDEPIANWDILPTFAEILGFDTPKDIDGISFNNLLRGQPLAKKHDYFYWEFYERGFEQAVRKGNWKAVKCKENGFKTELFDLEKDVSERQNLAKTHPEIVATMEKIMVEAHTYNVMEDNVKKKKN
jgi:arylsulfatase A-like enzyme